MMIRNTLIDMYLLGVTLLQEPIKILKQVYMEELGLNVLLNVLNKLTINSINMINFQIDNYGDFKCIEMILWCA